MFFSLFSMQHVLSIWADMTVTRKLNTWLMLHSNKCKFPPKLFHGSSRIRDKQKKKKNISHWKKTCQYTFNIEWSYFFNNMPFIFTFIFRHLENLKICNSIFDVEHLPWLLCSSKVDHQESDWRFKGGLKQDLTWIFSKNC